MLFLSVRVAELRRGGEADVDEYGEDDRHRDHQLHADAPHVAVNDVVVHLCSFSFQWIGAMSCFEGWSPRAGRKSAAPGKLAWAGKVSQSPELCQRKSVSGRGRV